MTRCPRCAGAVLRTDEVVMNERYTMLWCPACGEESDFRPARLSESELPAWRRTLPKVSEVSWPGKRRKMP